MTAPCEGQLDDLKEQYSKLDAPPICATLNASQVQPANRVARIVDTFQAIE